MADINGTGGDDTLIGTPDDDVFHGNGGNDDMSGLAGNDTYYVEDSGDDVFENDGEGVDTVFALANYVLNEFSFVEFLTADPAAGSAPISLTGNHQNNTITGNGGADVLHGGGGVDVLVGLAGDDIYYTDIAATQVQEAAGGGNDTLYTSLSYVLAEGTEVETLSANDYSATTAINLTGNHNSNTLIGNAGANVLHGGGGTVDFLIGLGGDDIYYVDVGGIGVQIQESVGGGNDIVYTSVGFELRSGIEIEVLSANNYASTDPFFISGNEFDQTIIGNAGANGLNGGLGHDILIGLGGDDTYNTDGDDVIREDDGNGNDTVVVYANSFVLVGASIEIIRAQSGFTVLGLTGNYLDQTIFGNEGNNILLGGGGTDILRGELGNDVYYTDVAATLIEEVENAGSDTLYTSFSYALAAGNSIERLDTNDYAVTIAIDLTGNEVGQVVTGNAGANTLDGRGGDDILYGLGGADNFDFTTAPGAGNLDLIADFSVADDTIRLDDAVFAALGGPGGLDPNAFATGSAAADADDRIVYNSATGQLFYDADGNGGGAAVQFALLASGLALTASDFQVI